MAWEIAIIVDPHYSHTGKNSLENDMPVWLVDTPENRPWAIAFREATQNFWLPEPACTTFSVCDIDAPEDNCLNVLDMVEVHHPNVSKLHLVGVNESERINSAMRALDFISYDRPLHGRVTYIKPVSKFKNALDLRLNASVWKTVEDIYDSLFVALGAPSWHGRNFNALNDSMFHGSVNRIEVPYTITIENLNHANLTIRPFVSDLVDFISDLARKGCPISVQIKDN